LTGGKANITRLQGRMQVSNHLTTRKDNCRAKQTLAAGAILAPLAPAPEHLRQQEQRRPHRAGREAAGEAAEERGRARRIVETPEVWQQRDAVDVYVLRGDEFQKSRAP